MGPAFGFTNAPNPTLWITNAGILYYYNGTGFSSSGHSPRAIPGGTTFALNNIGGSKNYIYTIGQNGEIYRYTGVGNGSLVASIPDHTTGTGTAQDIIGDEDDNFYLFRHGGNGPALSGFDASGAPYCSVAVNNFTPLAWPYTDAISFAIIGNTLAVSNNTNYYVGLLTNSPISLSATPYPISTVGIPYDLGSKYLSTSISSTISASPNNTLTCAQNTIHLSIACQSLSPLTFTWSGPGIVGSANNQTITANQIGVYTCSVTSHGCPKKHAWSTFTVVPDAQFITPVINGPGALTCLNPSPALLASPNSTQISYAWTGPGILGANNTSSIQLNVQGTYSLLMSNSLTGCSNATVVTIANQVGPLNVATTPGVAFFCQSAQPQTITATGAGSYTWLPNTSISSTLGSVVSVSPNTSMTYTVLGTEGICSGSTVLTVFSTANPTVTAQTSATFMCRGQNPVLSATGAYAYNWQPGNINGTTVTVSPSVTTVYTVVGNYGGCLAYATVTVNVDLSPPLLASVNPTVICHGESVTLTASGVNSYTWQGLGSNSASLVLSPSVTTTFSVAGTNTVGCTEYVPLTCVVNYSTPYQATLSSPTVCANYMSVQLFANSPGATVQPPGVVNGSNVYLNPGATTNYTITHSNGLCPSVSYVTLTVSPAPTISVQYNPVSICAGNPMTITPSGADSYVIAGNNIANGQSVVLFPAANASIGAAGYSSVGCPAFYTLTPAVSPTPFVIPTHSPNIICAGSNMTLSAGGSSSYTWMPGPITTPSFVATATAPIVYTVTGKTGSCSTTTTYSINIYPNPTIALSANPGTVCAGNVVTINAMGASSYTFLPFNIPFVNTTYVGPFVNTSYTIVGSNGFCWSSATIGIVALPSPTLNAYSFPSTICSGDASTLTASGANTYTWLPGNVGTPIYTVNPTSPTVYTVNAQVGTCFASKIASINVLPSPTVTVAPLNPTICPGGSVTLNAATTATYNYWFPGGIQGTSITVAPSASVVYTLYTALGSCMKTNTIPITISSLPTLVVNNNAPLGICNGTILVLNASGAFTYTWFPGNHIGTSYTVTSPGTYSLNGLNSVSCVASTTVSVGTYSNPIVSVTISDSLICPGQSATLTAFGATTYSWNTSATGSITIVSPLQTTLYQVIGTDTNACSNTATVNLSLAECLGFREDDHRTDRYFIYPNPNQGEFTLTSEGLREDTKLILVNLLGQVVLEEQVVFLEQKIDLKRCDIGLYSLILIHKNQVLFNAKLVKE